MSALKSKRDIVPQVSVRLTPEEDLWLRRHAMALDMDVSELMRKAMPYGVAVLMAIPFSRKIDIQDSRTDPECR
jgi:hypothetical protein